MRRGILSGFEQEARRVGFNAEGAEEERRVLGEERIKHRLTQEHRLKPVLPLKFDETRSAIYGV